MWRRNPSPVTRITSGREVVLVPSPAAASRTSIKRIVSLRRVNVAANGLKRGEVVSAEQRLCGEPHRLDIQPACHMPHVALIERRHERPLHDSIFVGFGNGAEPGVEVRRGVLDGHHPHVDRENRIEGPLQRGATVLRPRAHTRDLPQRVHTRIRPPGAMNAERFTLEGEERLFEQSLNRDSLRLTLPADVVRAVVLDGQLQCAVRQ